MCFDFEKASNNEQKSLSSSSQAHGDSLKLGAWRLCQSLPLCISWDPFTFNSTLNKRSRHLLCILPRVNMWMFWPLDV